MKIKLFFVASVIFSIFVMSLPLDIYAQQSVEPFWDKFKNAVIKGDKKTVASLTYFPLNMPYGVKSVKSKADFIKRYDKIMNMEADASRCFSTQKIGWRIGFAFYFLLVGWFVWAHRPRRLASAKLLAGLAITALGFDALVLASFALPSGWILLAAVLAVDDYESRHRQPPSDHV